MRAGALAVGTVRTVVVDGTRAPIWNVSQATCIAPGAAAAGTALVVGTALAVGTRFAVVRNVAS